MPHDSKGFVSLVGSGPGDVDHLTIGALRAIEGAQALLYDALVHPDIIALAPKRCIKICVGKRGDRLSEHGQRGRDALLSEEADHLPLATSLPLGMRRMLEVARAVIAEPRVLLLDEIASGMDEDELVRELEPEVVAHRLEDAEATTSDDDIAHR